MSDAPRPLILEPGEALSASTPDGGTAYFEVTRRIGEGGSGIVYEAVADDGRLAIVKGPKLVGARDPALERELELLSALPAHPAVVPLLGVVRSSRGHVLLVLERFFDNPYHRLNSPAVLPRVAPFVAKGGRYAPLPPAIALELGFELALALEHLHAHKVAHCDVKPQNLLVGLDWHEPTVPDKEYFERIADGRWRGVLIDLGGARFFKELDRARAGSPPPMLTPVYAPPEVLPGFVDESGRERSRYTPWIDAYAFGLTLYQLLTGHAPYAHLPTPPDDRDLAQLAEVKRDERDGAHRAISRAVLDGISWGDSGVDGCTREELTERLWDLLARSTHTDPAKRGTAKRIRVDLAGLLRVGLRPPVAADTGAPGVARSWRQTRVSLDAFTSRLALAGRDGTTQRADIGKLRRGGADFWEREGYRPLS